MKRIRVIDIVWVEDVKAYLPSISDELKELEKAFKVKFAITERNDSNFIPEIAANIPSTLVFCVDYNLKNSKGEGIDGDAIIRLVREKNPTCSIVFYSANLNTEELLALISNNDNYTTCVYRPNLLEKLREMFQNGDL